MQDTEKLEQLQTPQEQKSLRTQRLISVLVTILLTMAVLLCVYVVVQVLSNGYVNIGGFMMFRVVTGSMEPTIPTGALLLTRQADIHTIALNDIVCFRTQESEIWGKIVTHRVVEVMSTELGPMLRTRGDANLIADGFLVDSDNLVGKVIWHTGNGSMLASVFSFFTNKVGFLGCIVFPCLLLAGMILKDCVGNIRKELQQTLAELEADPAPAPADADPMAAMTQQEYDEMYERIREELIKELMNCGKGNQTTE